MVNRNYLNWKLPRQRNNEQPFCLALWIMEVLCLCLLALVAVTVLKACDPVLTSQISQEAVNKAYFDALGKEVASAHNNRSNGI